MATHTAFFYGTLMAPPVLRRVIHGPHQMTPELAEALASTLTTRSALLPHYQRHKVQGADYPAILPSQYPEASVRGTLISGLTDADMWRLDIFEGSDYKRRKVTVKVESAEGHNDEEVEAETYVWIAGSDLLEGQEWDFEEFVREKMGRWAGDGPGADSGFKDVEDAVATAATQGHDPTGGRGTGGHITRALESLMQDEPTASKEEEKVIKSAV